MTKFFWWWFTSEMFRLVKTTHSSCSVISRLPYRHTHTTVKGGLVRLVRMFYGLIWENENGYDTALPLGVERERYKMLIGPENGYRSLLISLFLPICECMKMTLQGEKSLWTKILKDKSRSRNFYSFSGQWSRRRRCSIYWGLRNCVREYYLVQNAFLFSLCISAMTQK